MRRRRIRRELAALGHAPHHPTEETRAKVKILAFNRVPANQIAEMMGIDITVLHYWYRVEMAFTEAEVLAQAAKNILELATQRADLGVALRANETILKTRSAAWREPRPVDGEKPTELKPARLLTLKEIDDELQRVGGGPKDRAAGAGPDAPEGEGKPH